MLRNRIIVTAMQLFRRYGINRVGMKQVASTLAISTKTLYKEFDSKYQLLTECITIEVERLSNTLRLVRARSTSAVETIVVACTDLCRFYATFCPTFYRDLRKSPEALSAWNDFTLQLKQYCMKTFREGVDEGYFLIDANYELISVVMVDSVCVMRSGAGELVSTILRGMCTAKGMEVLFDLQTKARNMNQTI